MKTSYSLTKFSPGDVERITGLTTAMQRDWRRRGFLEKSEGHSRFNVFELAKIWSLKLAADRSIGPASSKSVVIQCGNQIAWNALRNAHAYSGDHWKVPDEYNEYNDPGVRTSWGGKGRWLANEILFGSRQPYDCNRYFIWWPDGTFAPTDSLDSAFMSIDPANPDFDRNQGLIGFSLVIDCVVMGRVLLDRIGGPVASISTTEATG